MTFDDGYDTGDVVRCYFGHSVGRSDGHPFARQDLIVTDGKEDAVEGHAVTVSDKSRGSLTEDDADRKPAHDVRVRNETRTVRKSAVVMKRRFGNVTDDDVRIKQDPTGTWSDGGDE